MKVSSYFKSKLLSAVLDNETGLWELHLTEMRKECWDWLLWPWVDDRQWYSLVIKTTAIPVAYTSMSYNEFAVLLIFFIGIKLKTHKQNQKMLWTSATKESMNQLVSQDWNIPGHLLRQKNLFGRLSQSSLKSTQLDCTVMRVTVPACAS